MNTMTLSLDTKTNVGTADRVIRFAIGSGLIAVPLLYTGVDAEYAALTALIAIPIMFTAMASWCPVYAFFHIQSMKHRYDSARFFSRNVSNIDSYFRYVLAATLILISMLTTSTADPALVLLALIAIPVAHSAITKWDPLYALFEVGSYGTVNRSNYSDVDVINIHDYMSTDTQPTRPTGGITKAA